MLKRINLMISKSGVWIFALAALYRFTFWIFDMVDGFKWKATEGLKALFGGMIEMVLYLVILAVILEVSRKIAEKYTQADFAPAAPRPNNYAAPQYQQPQMPAQAPVQQAQPVQPAQPAAPVQPAAPSGVWYCAGCGTQNDSAAAFCAKCGKPK